MQRLAIIVCILGLITSRGLSFSGGSGTEADPYQIATAEDLIKIGSSLHYNSKDLHFVLVADIDLAGYAFDKAVISPDVEYPKGTYSAFDGTWFLGTFDGNGYTIRNLTIQGTHQLGLFGRVGGFALIKNVMLMNVNVVGFGEAVGGLVGESHGGDIVECVTMGVMEGDKGVGGMVGNNIGSDILRCYSRSTVQGISNCGGLVGANTSGHIELSFSYGSVDSQYNTGGLVGIGGTVTNCFCNATVFGFRRVGGMAGATSNIRTSYCVSKVMGKESVGGLIGADGGTVIGGLWNIEISGIVASSGGVGLTTAEMTNLEMLGLNGFASDPNWVFAEPYIYPRLVWKEKRGQVIPEPEIDWLSGSGSIATPYQIDNVNQLITLSKASLLWRKHFVLNSDIDLKLSLPDDHIFHQAVIPHLTGSFNGNGHSIKNLDIRGESKLGFIGTITDDAFVSELRVLQVSIQGEGRYIGALVARNVSGAVMNCYSSGVVHGDEYVGGLVGYQDHANISCSSSTVNVQGRLSVGGLVGQSWKSHIVMSDSSGTVTAIKNVGGLVGLCSCSELVNCYSSSSVEGIENIGGLVGYYYRGGNVIHCYSIGCVNGQINSGGLIGYNINPVSPKLEDAIKGNVLNSFWNIISSGIQNSDGGVGLTVTAMSKHSTYREAGWDFVGESENGVMNVWGWSAKSDYPIHVIPRKPRGQGTDSSPFLIETAEALGGIWYRPLASYKIVQNISLHGYTWRHPVVPCFGGTLDGNGHVIRGLTMEGSLGVGFVGSLLCNGIIDSIGIERVSITVNENVCGGLIARNAGLVTQCYTTGDIIGDGWLYYTGGLVGFNTFNGVIKDCYSHVSVIGSNHVGGLVGHNGNGDVINSYSTGLVTASGYNVSGLVGFGRGYGVVHSFWDVETSNQFRSYGGSGLSTTSMQDVLTYLDVGWDFKNETANGIADIWKMPLKGYPKLSWQRDLELTVIESFEATGDDGMVLSINGFDQLKVGNTTFSNSIGWSNYPPEAADDLDLSTVAICDGQESVQTQFNTPVDAVVILTRNHPQSGLIQRLDENGHVTEGRISFETQGFSAIAYTSLGRPVYGVILSDYEPIYGIDISGIDGAMLDIYLVSVLGIKNN